MSLIAYNNDPKLKLFVLNQLKIYQRAGKLVKDYYWKNGKGCATGCTLAAATGYTDAVIDPKNKLNYERLLGIPERLAELENRIFAALDDAASQFWPENFANAITPGANLEMVWPKFALWLLTEELPSHVQERPREKSVIDAAADLYREFVETGTSPDTAKWLTTTKNAESVIDSLNFGFPGYGSSFSAYDSCRTAFFSCLVFCDPDTHPHVSPLQAVSLSPISAGFASRHSRKDFERQFWYRAEDKLIELLKAETGKCK